MKIHGSNHINFNTYQQQMQEQTVNFEILNQSKQLQKNSQPGAKRAKYVQDIKQTIDSGEYRVNPQKTAKKMIDFWKKHQ